MSSSLYYIDRGGRKRYFGKSLKREISPLIWNHDGSLCGDEFIDKDSEYWDEKNNKMVNLYTMLKKISKRNTEEGKEALFLTNRLDKFSDGFWIFLEC